MAASSTLNDGGLRRFLFLFLFFFAFFTIVPSPFRPQALTFLMFIPTGSTVTISHYPITVPLFSFHSHFPIFHSHYYYSRIVPLPSPNLKIFGHKVVEVLSPLNSNIIEIWSVLKIYPSYMLSCTINAHVTVTIP